MKYLLFLLFFTSFLYSQSKEDKMYSITYLNTFKHLLSLDSPREEYSRLLVDGNKSIYQIFNVIKLDTLKKNGNVTANDRQKYFSFNQHTVNITDSLVIYNDILSGFVHSYEETLNYKWTIEDDTKTIGGYLCKKALTRYGGRNWIAWYTLDLPINAGPYKFKGLPGLIIQITDTTNSYDFTFYAIVERTLKPFEKYYHKKPEDEWIITDRLDFNKIKANHASLSLNELMSYGQPGKKFKVVMVGNEDAVELRDPDNSGKTKDYNPIEIDYKD
jgi:GLPGLI family protein